MKIWLAKVSKSELQWKQKDNPKNIDVMKGLGK